eukprot:Nk52_evm72s230 gene=Nk52_evmTU72s230
MSGIGHRPAVSLGHEGTEYGGKSGVKYCPKRRPASHSEDDKEEKTRLIKVLDEALCAIIEYNDRLVSDEEVERVLTKFDANKRPNISILQYLERIAKYAPCSTQCFIIALIYLDRIIYAKDKTKAKGGNEGVKTGTDCGEIMLTSLNVHRLLITSIMTAAKYFDDNYYKNQFYARVGGVPNNELNTLELEFLFMLDFNLHITELEYEKYKLKLLGKTGNMFTNRGEFLYVEENVGNKPPGGFKRGKCLNYMRSVSMPEGVDCVSGEITSPKDVDYEARSQRSEGTKGHYIDSSGDPWTSAPGVGVEEAVGKRTQLGYINGNARTDNKENPVSGLNELCKLIVKFGVAKKQIPDSSKNDLVNRAVELCKEACPPGVFCKCPKLKFPHPSESQPICCDICKLPMRTQFYSSAESPPSYARKQTSPFTMESLKGICETLVNENKCLSPGFVTRSVKGIDRLKKHNFVLIS